MDKKDFEELRKAAQPLVDYINNHGCPHDMVVVQQDGVQVFNGVMGVPFPVRD